MLDVNTIYACTAHTTAAYYTKYLTPDGTGERPGIWCGRGAAELGLTGEVATEDLEALLSGHDTSAGALVNTGFSLCSAVAKNAVCAGGAAISASVQAGAGTYMYARGDLSRTDLALDYLNVATSTLGYKLTKGSASLSSAASAVRADRASRIAWSANISSGFGMIRTFTTSPMTLRAGGLQFGSNLLHAGSVALNGIGLGTTAGSRLAYADC